MKGQFCLFFFFLPLLAHSLNDHVGHIPWCSCRLPAEVHLLWLAQSQCFCLGAFVFAAQYHSRHSSFGTHVPVDHLPTPKILNNPDCQRYIFILIITRRVCSQG